MKKVVVIGSNSFTGAHFVDFLLAPPKSGTLAGQEFEVCGMSRSAEPSPIFLPYKTNPNRDRFRFQQLDLNHDLDRMMKFMDEWRPEYVVNFASQSMVAESWANPDHWFMTNGVSTVRFHDQLRKRDYLNQYLHISTPEVYGSCSGNVLENAPFNPSTPYAVSRAAADMSLNSFFKNYKFPVCFTRAANVYGPGQQLYRILPRTIAFARLGKKLPLHGGGHSVRSFIHVRDVADGTLRVMLNGKMGEAYHLSTPLQISIRQLVEKTCAMMGVKLGDVVEISDDRPGKDAAYLLDSSKARTTLGWKDEIPLEQGIQETIDWVDRNIDTIRTLPLDYKHKP